jgi:DNA-binding NarL/FixJ family response regulator
VTAVLVVEDERVLAAAVEVAIGSQPDMENVRSAGSVGEALEKMARHVPDVVLMDIELPDADGIEGTRRIKATYPEVSVLILTEGATPRCLVAAATAGAAGFLSKDSSFPEIIAAVRNPGEKIVIEGAMLRALIEECVGGQPQGGVSAAQPGSWPDWARLTAREREILGMMGEGLDPRAIADQLVVSRHTARGHIKNIMTKLGAHSQLQAVVIAARSGLVSANMPPPLSHAR